MMKLLAFRKMHKLKHQEHPNNVTTESKPDVTGMKMLTYAQMRKHKHTENPRCACHDIEAILVKVPEDLQSQFVRVYPRPQPRYSNRPTGVSMFREKMGMEMTVPHQDSTQQPQPSLESMVMAPKTTEEYIGSRGAEPERKQDEQLCMSQVANVVTAFLAQARKAVRFRPVPPSAPVDDPQISKERLSNASGKIVSEDGAMPQPPPPVLLPLQCSNAVRYRAHPRLHQYIREESCLGHHPGGEADSYYLPKQVRNVSLHEIANTANRAARAQQPDRVVPGHVYEQTNHTIEAPHERTARHPTRPDSPFPKRQQRANPSEKPKEDFCAQQRHDFSPEISPQSPTHFDETMDDPRPRPLRGTKSLPSMADMPSLAPPIQCDGYLLWPNLSTLQRRSGSALASPSSSGRDYATTEFGIPDDVSDGIPEAIPANDRFFISDSDSEDIEAERRSSTSSRFSIGSSADEDDHEDDNEDSNNGTDRDYRSLLSKSSDEGLPVIRGASLCSSSMGSSSRGNLPSLGYYEHAVSSVPSDSQDGNGILDRYLAHNMYLNDETESIDQSLFADFSGDFTGTRTPSLTSDDETSPSSSSHSESNNGVLPAPEDAVNTANTVYQSTDMFFQYDRDKTWRTF